MPGLDSEGEDGGSRRRVRLAKLAPEKRMLAKQVHGVFESQFWDQHVSSPASMQGILPAGPCVPPPSPMLAPSGVSRAQFMIASQAVGLPVFPSYVEDEGGLVRACN